MKRRYLINVLKYALAIGLLGFVIYRNWGTLESKGLAYVWQKHVVDGQPINYHFLVLAALCCMFAVSCTIVRWYFLVRAVGLPFTIGNAFRLGLVGYFFSAFLPGSVGGDIVKAAFIAREQNRRTVAVATVLIDRALALWALIWFVALIGTGFWLSGQLVGEAAPVLQSIVLTAAIMVGVTTVGWLLLGLLSQARAEKFATRLHHIKKVGHSAAEFWRAIWMYRCRPKTTALAMLIALIGHVGFVLTFYFCVLVLAEPGQNIPSLQTQFLIVPIGMVISATPFFPGGAGIAELGFEKLFEMVGANGASGVLGSLVQRVINWVLGLIGYLVYHRLKATHHPAPAQSIELATTASPTPSVN